MFKKLITTAFVVFERPSVCRGHATKSCYSKIFKMTKQPCFDHEYFTSRWFRCLNLACIASWSSSRLLGWSLFCLGRFARFTIFSRILLEGVDKKTPCLSPAEFENGHLKLISRQYFLSTASLTSFLSVLFFPRFFLIPPSFLSADCSCISIWITTLQLNSAKRKFFCFL